MINPTNNKFKIFKSIIMKILSYLLSLLFVCSLVLITSCGKDDGDDKVELTDQQKAAKALSDGSPWQVTTVVSKPEEDIDETPLMSLELSFGITGSDITIAPGSFSSDSDDDFFTSESNATWAWSGTGTSAIDLTGSSVSELTGITFSPNVENPTSITVTFVLTNLGGRAKGLGEYTVILE
jgi:hypothetical protein